MPDSPVLVTGASGYLASWVIRHLLDKGYTVHGTVRDLSNQKKIAHLHEMAARKSGELLLFEADLMQEGSFLKAMEGCQQVIHTASPFFVRGVKDANRQLIEPAKEGTRNVLDSVNQTPSVRKVVLTSSVAAILGDAREAASLPNRTYTESQWNESSSVKHRPYSYSKTVAERLAWEIADAQDRWKLVTVNPGFVFGPSLSNRLDSTSVGFVVGMAKGTFYAGLPDQYSTIVDVRDVSLLHVQAMESDTAEGRYIGVASVRTFFEMGQILKKEIGGSYRWPSIKAPKWLATILGPFFGQSMKEIQRNVGYPYQFDNEKSRMLGITYRPIEETLSDHVKQLIQAGLIPDKR